MSSARYILADVNVWLASIVEGHPHHDVATSWWRSEVVPSARHVVFCRLTQLGLLRLLTNERVMGRERKTIRDAWRIYEEMVAQDYVMFTDEPVGTESILGEHCALGGSSRKFWTDGYLAAFAKAGALELVTFDRDFQRYPGLQLVLLSPTPDPP
jgi:uncharacterized protein